MESAPTIISIVQAFKRYSTVEYIRLVKRGQAAPFDKHLGSAPFTTTSSAMKPITA